MLQHSRKSFHTFLIAAPNRSLTLETTPKFKHPILVTQSSSLQKKINKYAQETRTMPTIGMLIKESRSRDKNKIVRSSQFMRREFLVRISKVIINLQNLPYIVLTNADIKRVLDLYMYAFSDMLHQPEIGSIGDVDEFNEVLSGLLDDLQDIIWLLSKGISESQQHFMDKDFPTTVKKVMDRIVLNRLCNRVLARHHLSMHIQREGYVSVINTELRLKSIVRKNAAFAANVCQNVYMETIPEVLITGHVDTKVSFIPNIIDYVLREVLKNSFRATVEGHMHKVDKPPIVVTICNAPEYWRMRVSDQGAGIKDSVLKKIDQYCYTSFKEDAQYSPAFGQLLSPTVQDHGSSLAGYGVGIPVSNAYLNFVKGSLEFQTMPGLGTDVYIKVPHLNRILEEVRI